MNDYKDYDLKPKYQNANQDEDKFIPPPLGKRSFHDRQNIRTVEIEDDDDMPSFAKAGGYKR